jgi:DNA topoisomerase VI subunit A
MASSKGFVAGELRFSQNGALIDCRTQIVSVPPVLEDLDACPLSAAEFILVVEKDAVFQQLVADGFAHRFPCIMITVCRVFPQTLFFNA